MARFGLLLILLCFMPKVCAYGELGHGVICDIAFRSLTKEARQEVLSLLKATPYKTFAQACNWADRIRDDSKYDFAKPHHYINIPRGTERVVRVNDCDLNGCVVDAIKTYIAVLSGRPLENKNASKHYVSNRSEALMFLGHFVGDVHQPLHVSYADDQGGNQVIVTASFVDKPTNLHAVWDNYLITRGKADWRKMGKDLFSEIRPEFMRPWDQLSPMAWAQESHQLTQRIYQQLPPDHKLNDQYFLENNAIVMERIKIAGYRLGKVLNQAMKDYDSVQ
jgi:hypothetical protein